MLTPTASAKFFKENLIFSFCAGLRTGTRLVELFVVVRFDSRLISRQWIHYLNRHVSLKHVCLVSIQNPMNSNW